MSNEPTYVPMPRNVIGRTTIRLPRTMITKREFTPPPGSIPFGQWRREQARKRGIPLSAFSTLLYRGQVKWPKTVRKNQRVIYVVSTSQVTSDSHC